MKWKAAFAAWLLIAATASAKDFVVNAGDIPPFCFEADGRQTGIVVDMLGEVAKARRVGFNIRFVAWKRAQAETQSANDQLIIPLTRTPERERLYTWIAPLITYHFVIVTAGDRPAPRSIEEARGLSIGVLRGNPMEQLLPQMGFSNVVPGNTEEGNARLLQAGRIDAWVVADIVARDVFRRAGGNPKDLHVGPRVGEPMSIFLAASPQFPEADRKLLADELNRLRNSGEIERIVNRYRMP